MAPIEKVEEVPKLLRDASGRQYLPDIQLGSGGFATCFRASVIDRHAPPAAPRCALKAVKSAVPKNLVQRFRLELAIQSKLDHTHIVKMDRAFTFQDITYVSLELCPNGSLTDMMKRRKFLTMGEIRRMLVQLCGAVKYLHDRDVVHRDIKAGNIFLDENMDIKLGDFGLAAIMEPSPKSVGASAQSLQHIRRTTFCGTPNYLAPEILSREEGHGTSVDLWAIGILAYYLAVGRAPFHSKTRDQIYEKLQSGQYSWPELGPEQNEIPEDLRSLVASLLVEESQRPGPDEIVSHPFISEGFIPQRLEPLCRSRRPRWARVSLTAHSPEQRRVFEELCINAQVGEAWQVYSANLSKRERPILKSMFLVLAKEIQQVVKLEIPLAEGLVYTGKLETTASLTPSLLPRPRKAAASTFDVHEDRMKEVVEQPAKSQEPEPAAPTALASMPPRRRSKENRDPDKPYEIKTLVKLDGPRPVASKALRPLRSRAERQPAEPIAASTANIGRVRQGVAAIERRAGRADVLTRPVRSRPMSRYVDLSGDVDVDWDMVGAAAHAAAGSSSR